MRLKVSVLLTLSLAYMTVLFGSTPDGTNPPHAVDISGKAIPESSATQPDKPIILSKDSVDDKRGELKVEAAFDHTKHSTDIAHSIDGKSVTACVECHHTAQPKAPDGQEYLKKSDRKETLTAKQLETSKEPVQSCRTCHFQESWQGGDSPASIKYPKKSGKSPNPSGILTNDNAYHINCNSCHDAVMARESNVKDSKIKAPSACSDCHTTKAKP